MNAGPPLPPPRHRRANLPDLLLSERARGVMLLILALTATGVVLRQAGTVLTPILFGLVVGVVVSPLSERLHRWGVPRSAVAAALLVVAGGILVLAFIAIEPLLTALIKRLPEIRAEIESWVQQASGLLRGIDALNEEIGRTVGAQAAIPAKDAADLPSVMDAIWLAPNFGASVLIFAGTLFFFVLTRKDIYATTGRYRAALFRADRAVARYFAAVTIINIGLGLCTALVLSIIGVNHPLLWALAAGILNFILYLGPLTIQLGLLVAGLMQFGGAMSVVPPLAFLALNVIEAQFVTPAFVGQRLQINPLVVFLAIVLGLWLLGPVGAIVALPVALWLAVLVRAGQEPSEATAF